MLGLILIAGGSLSACNKKSGNGSLTVEAGRDLGAIHSIFGKEFKTAFSADLNFAPRNVQDSDVAPVSLTIEQMAINWTLAMAMNIRQ